MRNIIKSLIRYTVKKKFSLIIFSILLLVNSLIFITFNMLSDNMNKSYENLVVNGNLNNVTIYEKFLDKATSTSKLTSEEAQALNKKLFYEEIDAKYGSSVEYNDFRSIDYNTSLDQSIYKVIENEPSALVDRLVIDGGHNLSAPTYDFSKIIEAANWNFDSQQAIDSRKAVLQFASSAKWSDLDYGNKTSILFNSLNDEINKIGQIKQDPKFYLNSPNVNFKNAATILNSWLNKGGKNFIPIINSGYKISFQLPSGIIPIYGSYSNFLSKTTVVPEFVINKQNKKIISETIYNELQEFSISKANEQDFNKWFEAIPKEFKIFVGDIPYLIIGSGLSPNFMYPIFSFEKINPDLNSQIILYANSTGYDMAFNSGQSNPVENYTVMKYKGNKKINEIVDDINYISLKYMGWPANIKSTYKADDTTCLLSPAALRLVFLPQLIELQNYLNYIFSFFILVLTSIIFVIFVKKFVNENTDSLVILRTNGYSRSKLSLATGLFPLIPILIGIIPGYIISFLIQTLVVGIYKAYWFIPLSIASFNVLILFLSLLIPFIVLAIISIVSTYHSLGKDIVKDLNNTSNFKPSLLSKFLSRTMSPKIPILNRFRISMSCSSVSKLLILSVIFTLLSVSLTSLLAIDNQFNYAADKTFNAKKYEYSFNLATPTIQGGQYLRTNMEDSGKILLKSSEVNGLKDESTLNYTASQNDSIYWDIRGQSSNYDRVSSDFDYFNQIRGTKDLGSAIFANVQFPSLNDVAWQNQDLLYLKNKAQLEFILDVDIGFGPLSTNPWSIPEVLMPINQKRLSEKLNKNMWNRIINDETNYDQLYSKGINKILGFVALGQPTYFDFMKKNKFVKLTPENLIGTEDSYLNVKENKYYSINNKKFKTFFGANLNLNFCNFAADLLLTPEYQDTFYKIIYNNVILSNEDETFTKVESVVKNNFDTKFELDEKINFIGLQNDSAYNILENKDGENLYKLINTSEEFGTHEYYANHSAKDLQTNPIKVITNESAAYKYGLKIGSIIEIDPQQEATRYDIANKYAYFNSQSYKVEIVGINETYNDPNFFMNQKDANLILGLGNPKILETAFRNINLGNKLPQMVAIDPFNGFFSNDKGAPIVANSISLYSPSGLYLSDEKLIKNNKKQIDLIQNLIDFIVVLPPAMQSDDEYLFNSISALAIALGSDYQSFVNEIRNNSAETVGWPAKILDKLIDTYGDLLYLSTNYSSESKQSVYAVFKNTEIFITDIFYFVIIVLLIILILSIASLTYDIIMSTSLLICILKTIGLTNKENITSFLSILFPAIIIGIGLSIGLSYLVIKALQRGIFSFSNILLPLSLQWYYLFLPILIFISIFIIILISGLIYLKRINLAKTIGRYN